MSRNPRQRSRQPAKERSPKEVQDYLSSLAAHVLGEDPAEFRREVGEEHKADAVEALQGSSKHADPHRPKPREDLNRQMRRSRRRKKRLAKVVQAMVEKAIAEGADPDWKPEAFPALDWRIESQAWAIMRDTTGRKARLFAAALPPGQAEQLIWEAAKLAAEQGLDEGYATVRWRELVAGAWSSWKLSRPVHARLPTVDDGHTRLGDYVLGNVPPDPDGLLPPVKRENPWAGGRVVDGYARQAFCLLMRDLRTREPMSMSKLFYRNGSGQQGVFGYLATPRPDKRGSKLPRIDGVLGLYSRWQPRADRSKYVGPVKKGPNGEPLLGPNGQVQRYALCEHWYHRDMCGRRTAAQADRGDVEARSLLRDLCPWLFKLEASATELLNELVERAASVEDAEAPFPAAAEDAAVTVQASAPRGPPN